MRNHGILATLLVALLLAGATGAALAGGPDHAAPGRNRAADERPDHPEANHSARAAAHQARVAELKAARQASLDAFHENRSAALADYRAANEATRASFLENKTRVIEACRAARNASGDAPDDCVRDGLKPLIGKARSEHREHRETLLERLHEARQNALEGFRAARAHADARHGPRGG